jgi:hypothetical protein
MAGPREEVSMTLAFYPFGAFLAGLFLGSAFTLFAVGLRVLDRAAPRSGGTVLPGLVAGFRDWADGRHPSRIQVSTSPLATTDGTVTDPEGPEVVDLA